MPARRVIVSAAGTGAFESAFSRVRASQDLPRGFPPDALQEAEAAAARGPVQPPGREAPLVDRRDIPFLTIDPAGSTDLDQAFAAEAIDDGYRVFYAIADVSSFVTPGGPLDAVTRRRGTTLYSPDLRIPLHPEVLSEGAASLLPGVDRQALLWTVRLDRTGEPRAASLEVARVRSREQLSYSEAQERIDSGRSEILALLQAVGELRLHAERQRGAVSLNLPAQQVRERDGNYELVYDTTLPVEKWNAQISLLTGMVAADSMLEHRVGVLRTLPPPDQRTVAMLRRVASALGIDWPSGVSYADLVRDLDANPAAHAAFVNQAARLLRGAGYAAFDGERPAHSQHAAIAADYAHVTAPLRRLVDRFANEVVLAQHHGYEPPEWARLALPELPELMGKARQRESRLERAIFDAVEALVLSHRVGETFDAVVVDVDEEDGEALVQLREPAVIERVKDGTFALGAEIRLRLDAVDIGTGTVRFEPMS